MLNSKVKERSFVKFIEGKDDICLDVDKSQYIKICYSCYLSQQDKKVVGKILEAYKDYTDSSILNYFFEETVAYVDGKPSISNVQLNVEMLFRKVHKNAKVLLFNIAKEVIAFNNYIKQYIQEKYPQEFAVSCCFFKYNLDKYVSQICNYLEGHKYFKLTTYNNKYIKGVVDYNYTVEMVRGLILVKGYSGNITKLGVEQAFYDIADYIITLNKELVNKIKG